MSFSEGWGRTGTIPKTYHLLPFMKHESENFAYMACNDEAFIWNSLRLEDSCALKNCLKAVKFYLCKNIDFSKNNKLFSKQNEKLAILWWFD